MDVCPYPLLLGEDFVWDVLYVQRAVCTWSLFVGLIGDAITHASNRRRTDVLSPYVGVHSMKGIYTGPTSLAPRIEVLGFRDGSHRDNHKEKN